jgi:ribosomal protein S18 acetylase RimI-like enzyme
MNLEITENPSKEDDAFVINKLQEFNRKFSEGKFRPISIYARNNENEILGGLIGKTFGNWLHIECLWVAESERGKNIGSKLVYAAEGEAISRGCLGSTLDTYSFQALDFYKKLGYQIIGSLSGYSGKYQRHYMEKKLG